MGVFHALKLTKLFGIDDFPAAKDSGKVLIIIIYCYLIIILCAYPAGCLFSVVVFVLFCASFQVGGCALHLSLVAFLCSDRVLKMSVLITHAVIVDRV